MTIPSDKAAPAKQQPRKAVREPWTQQPVPPLPVVNENESDKASVTYAHYRTSLSNHRTGLSEHRTGLSEYRTDLSDYRTEMAMRRTGMAFQRTRMAADRTLMAVLRTSLSLIGFGFTIYQFFGRLREAGEITRAEAPRNFGMALVILGIALLAGGILYQLQFMRGLRQTRHEMTADGLIHGESVFPVSLTLISAILLLLIGLAAIASMAFNIGPFG